jgi:hypothetical protein
MELVTKYGRYENIELRAGRYCCDGSLAVYIWDRFEGCIAKLTTCLDDNTLQNDEAYVDSNNCEWAEDFLIQNHIATKLDRIRISGYCIYTAFKFDTSKLIFENE